jgi:hypothetical protein
MGRMTSFLFAGLLVSLGSPALHAHPVDVQSARAACETEADGRGFTVLEAGDPRDHKDGWSIAMRLRAYRGEVSTGSCFADSRTGNVSLYGFGWGDRSPTPANYIFSCASIDGGRHVCSLPLPGKVQVVERYSSAPCEAGQGWGQDGNSVWVARSCRAKFVIAPDSTGEGKVAAATEHAGKSSQIECRSRDGRYRECALGEGFTARLIQDLSGRCRDEADWGASEGLLWVNNGCHGRFERMPVGAPLQSPVPAQRTDAAKDANADSSR